MRILAISLYYEFSCFSGNFFSFDCFCDLIILQIQSKSWRIVAQNFEVSVNEKNGGNTNWGGSANGGNGGNINPLFIAMYDSPTASLVTAIFTKSNLQDGVEMCIVL